MTGVVRRSAMAGLLAGALALAGCGGMTPDATAEAMAKQAYQHLAHGEDAKLDALLLPAARGPNNAATYKMMRGLLPPGEPTSVTQTSWQAYTGTSGRRQTYQHTYVYPGGTVTATTVLVSPPGSPAWMVQSLNVNAKATAAPAPSAPTSSTKRT